MKKITVAKPRKDSKKKPLKKAAQKQKAFSKPEGFNKIIQYEIQNGIYTY